MFPAQQPKQPLHWASMHRHSREHLPTAAQAGVEQELHCRAVPDSQTLGVLLAAHLAPQPGKAATLHALRAYVAAPQACLAVLMQRPGCPAHSPEHHLLDKASTLGAQLAGKHVVEWPVLCVVLPQDLPGFLVAAEQPSCAQPAAAATHLRRAC